MFDLNQLIMLPLHDRDRHVDFKQIAYRVIRFGPLHPGFLLVGAPQQGFRALEPALDDVVLRPNLGGLLERTAEVS